MSDIIDLKTQLNAKNREIVVLQKNVESLTKENRGLKENTEKLMSAIETLRITLAKNPKYAIIFVLEDIQTATVRELDKTL